MFILLSYTLCFRLGQQTQSVVCCAGRPYSQLCRSVRNQNRVQNNKTFFHFLLSKNQMQRMFAYLRQKIKTTIEIFEKSREIVACTMKSLRCPFDLQGNGGDHLKERTNKRLKTFVKTQMSKFNDRHALCLNEI